MSIKQEEEKFEVFKITDSEIKEFERELEDYQQSSLFGESEGKELEFYGRPLKNQTDFKGYVSNDLLGATHFSVVRYCLDKGIIKRHNNGIFAWLVNYEDAIEKGQKVGLRLLDCPYKEFIRKWKGLQDLKIRRNYAQDMESENSGMPVRNRIRKILDEQKPKIGQIFSGKEEKPQSELERIEKLAEKSEISADELGF